jgi:hypothetical protein
MAHPAVVPLEVRRHPTRSARLLRVGGHRPSERGGDSDGMPHRTGLGRDDALIVCGLQARYSEWLISGTYFCVIDDRASRWSDRVASPWRRLGVG